MKRSFLLMLLLTILPFAAWATKPVGTGHVTGNTDLVFKTGAKEQVLLKAVTAPNNHGTYDTSVGKVRILVKDNATKPIKSNPNWVEYNVGDVPAFTGTDAKTYYVFYYFTNDGTTNYDEDGDVANITVAIGKKNASAADGDFTAPTPVLGLVFDNTAKAVVSATKPASGHFVYQYRQQTTYSSWSGWSWSGWSTGWSEALPTGTNAREYQIRYRYINEDGNYNDWNTSTYQTITAQIARATWGEGAATYTAPKQKEDAIFNNSNQNMVTAGETPAGWGAEMEYRTTTWRNTVDHNDFRSTNVMQNGRTVYYRIQGGNGYNWNALSQATISVNILPADAPAATGGTLATSPLTYTGNPQQLITDPYDVTILGLGGGNTRTIHYYVNGVDRGTNINTIRETESGEYKISYGIVFTGNPLRNYKPVPASDATVLGTVTIDKAKLTIANVGYTKDFDNVAFEATPENVVKFVDGLGWVHSETDEQKAQILGKLLTVKKGLPQINVGAWEVELESKEDPSVSYVIDPLFHETAELNILKIKNTWKTDVTIAATWAYGSTPAAPSCEPNLTKKEDGNPAEITYKYYKDAACTDEMDAPTATTAAGTYYVKAFVEGCNNFFPLESVTPASFEITPTSPTWTKPVEMAGWEYTKYDVTANAPSAEAIDDATITFKFYEDAACTTEIDADDVPTLGVGKYYVKAFAAATANHTADENGPAEFEVTPTVLPATGIDDVEKTYNATNQNPGETAINFAIKENTGLVAGTDYELSFDPTDDFTEVGEYYIIATGKGNYAKKVDGDVNVQKVKVTIKQADIPLEDIIAAKANNLTYNNTDQVLAQEASIKAGSILVGKFEYSLTGEDGSWTPDVPTGFNAGDYKVYTKFTPSGNFKDNFEVTSIDAKILQKQIGYMLSNFEKTWDGLELSFEDIEKCYSLFVGELQGNDQYVAPFTLTLPKDLTEYLDAGSYTFKQMKVEWTDEKVQNYKINWSGTGEVVINKADIDPADFEAPTLKTGMEYNGDPFELVTAGKILTTYQYSTMEKAEPIAEMLYFEGETAPAEDSEDWTVAIPEETDAAETYPVWYMVKGDKNHNNYVAKDVINSTIAPRVIDFALNFESERVVYDGSDFMPEDVNAYDGDIKEENKLEKGKDYTLIVKFTPANSTEFTEVEKPELINVGKYEFKYTGINNYEGSKAEATITIGQFDIADATVSEYKATTVYNAKDQKPTITLSYNGKNLEEDEDYTLVITNTAGDEVTDFVNADEYTFTFTGIGNYGGTNEPTFTITPLDVIGQAANATKKYDGTTDFVELPVISYSGVLKDDVVEFDASAAFVFGEDLKKDVGTYAFEVKPEAIVVTPANYKVVGATGADFIIEKKNMMVTWAGETPAFTKVYGAEDPELTITAEDLNIIDAVESEKAAIVNQIQATRAEGEAAGLYAIQLSAKEFLPSVFANYNVAGFDEDIEDVFEITGATVKVAVTPKEKFYDGKDATIELTASDLTITGLQNGDKKEDVFTKLPSVSVEKGTVAGEYQITLGDDGESDNYVIETLPSIYTIKKAEIVGTITAMKVRNGDAVEEIEPEFKVTCGNAIYNDFFTATVADAYQNAGVVEAADGTYADGLVLVPINDEVADNTTGWDAITGELTIATEEIVVLNDAEDWTSEGKTDVTVRFEDRTINADNWNVVALPFTASVAEISAAFGYAAVDVLNDMKSDGNIHFQIKTTGNIEAYHPFIIKTTNDDEIAKADFNEVVFEHVNIEAWTEAKNSDLEQDLAGNIFWGTFMANTAIPAGSLKHWYMSGGTWYDTSNRTKAVNLKAFRAYVEFKEAKAGARIFIEEPDGTETSIDAIEFNNMINGDIYTVDGKKVNRAAQKGIYIQNGKKVAVK